MTIARTPKESYTIKQHYNLIVTPSHRDFIKNMTAEALQANTAHIIIPADGSSPRSLPKTATRQAKSRGRPGTIRRAARLISWACSRLHAGNLRWVLRTK